MYFKILTIQKKKKKFKKILLLWTYNQKIFEASTEQSNYPLKVTELGYD